MSLFRTPERHAENAPDTWVIVRAAERVWQLQTKDGGVLDAFPTKTQAVTASGAGFLVDEYASEGQWFSGITPAGQRSWAECEPEVRRIESLKDVTP